jgi:RNA-directed DNA polymerase
MRLPELYSRRQFFTQSMTCDLLKRKACEWVLKHGNGIRFLGLHAHSGKTHLGRFAVRRTTIRKRMRAKLRQIKLELRKRMHDPVAQTGQWLKSVVQGYFNYYAVPRNTASLNLFRHRVLVHWWHTVRRRGQKCPISWTRMLVLANRWLPRSKVLHPYPEARFAAHHPR